MNFLRNRLAARRAAKRAKADAEARAFATLFLVRQGVLDLPLGNGTVLTFRKDGAR